MGNLSNQTTLRSNWHSECFPTTVIADRRACGIWVLKNRARGWWESSEWGRCGACAPCPLFAPSLLLLLHTRTYLTMKIRKFDEETHGISWACVTQCVQLLIFVTYVSRIPQRTFSIFFKIILHLTRCTILKKCRTPLDFVWLPVSFLAEVQI